VRNFAIVLLFVAFGSLGSTPLAAQGQTQRHGDVIVPDTSVERLEDLGKKAHTNHLILFRPALGTAAPTGETPASLACVYRTASTITPGCPVRGTSINPLGGAGVIAIVDAYDYPTAENDLNVFSSTFGLPPCLAADGCFQQVYASGFRPPVNCGWAQEAALDIEWAHAMAPSARIVLVEAASNSLFDLFNAVDVAGQIVSSHPLGGEVSMSWGASEFFFETIFDFYFTGYPNVVYFAASGDSGGRTIYPSVSPFVVSAGGTTINRDSSGNFMRETGWSGSGGGRSAYESRPHYQDVIVSLVGSRRGTPDFSFDADPHSGVSVYDSTPCSGLSGWLVFGGTSVSAPSLAGIVNLASHFYSNSDTELSTIYADYASPSYSTDFRDIILGTAGRFSCRKGWDFVTGVGSNQGTSGK
jgi:subtilase family serine protease